MPSPTDHISHQQSRYPGVRPFSTSQKDFFFGRNEEIRELHDLVQLQKMVVLFARSGFGKSSIIHAGLVPRLQSEKIPAEERYTILIVRPGSYVDADKKKEQANGEDKMEQKFISLEERLRLELERSTPEITAPFLDNLCEKKSLWYYFKQRQSKQSERFLLVFDQFEEFFSHPSDWQLRFKTELAELLYETIPQEVRRASRHAAETQREFLARALHIKVLFAIRDDRLSLLQRMKAELPAIFDYGFELKALNSTQAKEAIIKPALLPEKYEVGGNSIAFSSPPFEYNKDALEQILNNLAGNRATQDARIGAFLLQVVCTWIEGEVRAGRVKDRDNNGLPDVLPEDLPDFTNIYETYYKQQLERLNPTEQQVARQVIESEFLLFINPQSGEGRRLGADKDLLLVKFEKEGLTEALLLRLEDTFLLRRETNSLGEISYEISHDALIDPIARARKERLEEAERLLELERTEKERKEAEARALEAEEKARVEAQRRAEAEKLQQEAENQKREADKQRDLAENRRRSARILTYIAITLALAASVLGLWAWDSASLARKRLLEVERANAERDLFEFKQLISEGDELFKGKYYPSALKNYQTADSLRQLHPENERYKLMAQSLSEKINLCREALKNR